MGEPVTGRPAARDDGSRPGSAAALENAEPLPLHPGVRMSARVALALVVFGAAIWIARDFLPALVWAAMLAIAVWPLYAKMAGTNADAPSATRALLFTLLVALLVFLPIALVGYEIAQQSELMRGWIAQARDNGIPVPEWVAHLPVGAGAVEQWWEANLAKPQSASAWLQRINAEAVLQSVGGQLVNRAFMLFVSLIALFVLLYNGGRVAHQLLATADRIFGDPGEGLVEKIVGAIRGTVNGTVVVAVGEGLLIGAGYLIAGVPHWPLFTVVTIAFAMLPFGAWAAFSAAALTLLVTGGGVLAAAGVFAWGAIVMVAGDHFLWPTLVGGAARLPFLFAFIGIFGGVASFGLVGLFLGPVIMAASLTIWREWVMRTDRRRESASRT